MVKEYVINSVKYGEVKVLLDDEDYKKIIDNNIKLHPKFDKTINNFYIQLHITKNNIRSTIGLHRYIMGDPKDKVIDHINRNTLDNTKNNLRIVTQQENSLNKGNYKNNKSGHKGVYYINLFKCWIAELKYNKKCYRSKRCKTKEDAIKERKLLEERVIKGVINDDSSL